MVCFIIALQGEADCIIKNMEVAGQSSVCGKKIYRGRLCGKDCAVIVCGVGKTNAAAATQMAIDRFSPSAIVNFGVAGALNSSCEIGGIYAISRAVQYDFDLAEINGTKIGTLNEFEERYLALSTVNGYEARTLGTGDRFNDNIADYKLLTEDIGADIRDMEGAAIVHICIHAEIPCYCFKCISDKAGNNSTIEQYRKNLELCFKNMTNAASEIFKNIL